MVLPEYEAIYELNRELFGWLHIEDTPINYPVMHTPEDPQYYLRRAFDKSDSQSGTPFLDGTCFEGCGNYVIYGHNMARLCMTEVTSVRANECYEHGEYEDVAAFYGKAIAKGEYGFRYYQYTDPTDPAAFGEYISHVNAAAIYDTEVTAEYGDELLTTSTCSYHTTDDRFIAVARRITN